MEHTAQIPREDAEQLAADPERRRNILCALGNESCQHPILERMKMGQCSGVRVGDITERTHLSRPAVSYPLPS